MRFEVPQYLDVPDKIFGQFTLKQVLYVVGSIGASYILWRWLGIYFAIPIGGGLIALAFMLGFTPENKYGRSFEAVFQSAITFAMKPRLYTWKRLPPKKRADKEREGRQTRSHAVSVTVPTISKSNLSTMAWSLDVGEKEEL